MPSTVAVVLCAGQGTRMGAAENKVFLPLGGIPILVRTLRAFDHCSDVDELVLVAHPAEIRRVQRDILCAYPLGKPATVVAGGVTRHQSEHRALDALRARIESGEMGVVLIHDGARPFVTAPEIAQVVAVARTHGAAILGAPLAPDETLLAVTPDGTLQPVLAPEELLRAQTPQAFDAVVLLAAYDRAWADGFEGTDTAAALERLGMSVPVVASSRANLTPNLTPNVKLTTPDDLLRAEAWLRAQTDTDTDSG